MKPLFDYTTYCEVCGAENIPESTGRFDRWTGEEVMRPICPKDPCKHTGHDVELVRVEISIWDVFRGSLRQKCKRCGETITVKEC